MFFVHIRQRLGDGVTLIPDLGVWDYEPVQGILLVI